MQIIGLTGGIGTGKSSACRLLKEIDKDLIIIDADILSHEATKINKFPYLLLKYLFLPRDCFDSVTGELKRSQVAELIFGQSRKSRKLKKLVERCIHPWVIWKILIEIVWYWFSGKGRIVLDIPLLFEVNLKWLCTRTLLIDTSNPEIQFRRILSRCPQLTEKEIRNRMASQFSMEIKRKLADFVVNNDQDGFENLKTQLENDFSCLSLTDLWIQRFLYLYFPILILILILFSVITNL